MHCLTIIQEFYRWTDRQTDTTPTLNNSIGMTYAKERTVNKIVTIVALD